MTNTINARSAQAQADVFLQTLTDTAAAKGVALVARGSVVAASQFPDWPTKLAEALCADPSLAGQSNQTLAAVIEARSGKTGFNTKLLSKTLSNLQRSYAVGVLERYGYATASLAKGTDIKRIVRDNVRVATPEALEASTVEIKTTFYADGLSIDSRPYQYRQRQTTPTGNPWYDFCVRIGGSDTPLQMVLVLRGVGISEFRQKDEAAQAVATPEQAQRRSKLDREAKEHRSLAGLRSAACSRLATAFPSHPARTFSE
jgi:hypothetical protein